MHRGRERAVDRALQVDPTRVGRVSPLLVARLLGTRPVEGAPAFATQLKLLGNQKPEQVFAKPGDHGQSNHAVSPSCPTPAWPLPAAARAPAVRVADGARWRPARRRRPAARAWPRS